jgi:hypothetical protein
VYEPLVWLAPLMVNLRARGGWLLLPGRDVPLDLADRRAVSGGHAIPTGHGGAFAWRSQEGMLVRDCGGSRLFDAVWTERTGELQWRAGLVWTGLSAGQDFAVAVDRREVPFLSTIDWASFPAGPQLHNKVAGASCPGPATPRELIERQSSQTNITGRMPMPLCVRVRESAA